MIFTGARENLAAKKFVFVVPGAKELPCDPASEHNGWFSVEELLTLDALQIGAALILTHTGKIKRTA